MECSLAAGLIAKMARIKERLRVRRGRTLFLGARRVAFREHFLGRHDMNKTALAPRESSESGSDSNGVPMVGIRSTASRSDV